MSTPLHTALKKAELLPEIQLQEHQQRVADRLSGDDPRLLVYHGLGSGKSLSAIAAAEMARRNSGRQYGIVVPASLRGNFQKEIKKFTRNSDPEILSYSGLALGKRFKETPDTLVMDEAQRLRNPGAGATTAAQELARKAERLVLLSGTPITNSPTDLASLISMLNKQNMSPGEFEKRYIGYKKKFPGVINWLRGAQWGEEPYVKNEKELRELLKGKVDYQPSKTPQGVTVNEETVAVPLSAEQSKIQKAIRTQIPPGFLWKLDQEFPLSRDELKKLNSFLTGLRQVSLSTQPFRNDKNPLKAFDQSSKLREALKRLRENLDQDPRRKAIVYSNFIDAGIEPYAKALERENIPYGVFHGGMPVKARQEALKNYNEGKLRALLLGPAAAEGISTKGTSLIQLLDPYWHESRTQQARGRGLRFDSHDGLPEELKNVAVQRFLSASQEPNVFSKYVLGRRRQRTGDEILQHLADNKEQLNEAFRKILRDVGSEKTEKTEKTSAQLFGEKLAEQPTVTPLAGPQAFPKPAPAADRTTPPPVFRHPSGALQLGKMRVLDDQNTTGGARSTQSLGIDTKPKSPGADSGPGVLRISQHGGTSRGGSYVLSNPTNGTINVSRRAEWAPETSALPPGTNPSCLISDSCNGNADGGADPSLYARWLNSERRAVNPQDGSASNLKKVVMMPPGYLSANTFASHPFPNGSFDAPYLHGLFPASVQEELRKRDAAEGKDTANAPHEYRLLPGGDPTRKGSWLDTGNYTDARQSAIPLIGAFGEAQEFGRHLGLGPELGGGNATSYLDKIRAINNNPDATYGQKVMSNFARPVGSALQFGRELSGLGYDTAGLAQDYLRNLW